MTHYETEEDAIAGFPQASVYQFAGGTLTIAVVSDWHGDIPHVLLREQEGLFWCPPERTVK